MLDDEQLAVLTGFGQRRRVEVGDVLYAEGDAAYDFFVVLSGAVDIVGTFDGVEEVLVTHTAGRFLGELNLLTGQRVYLTARVAVPGEVVAVPVPELRRLIATVPGVSDVILGALVARRSLLLEGAARSIRVIGSRHLPEALAMREFLTRNRLPTSGSTPRPSLTSNASSRSSASPAPTCPSCCPAPPSSAGPPPARSPITSASPSRRSRNGAST